MKEVTLTSDQLAAVDVSKRHLDACVVAGPGSGKTTVLVEYFRRLVAQGVDPLRILAITFTEKAAGNMRKRLAETFQEDHTARARLERAWVSTVHGFCARLLRENAISAGVDPEFSVADERESWRMQQECIVAAIEELFAEHPQAVKALVRGLSSYEFEEAVLSAYDAMRGAGVRVEQLARFPEPPGITLAEIALTLNAIRGESLSAWSYAQKQQLLAALEGAGRIAAAHSPREALAAIAAFSCNLTKCKRGNNAYNLLSRLKTLTEDVKYTLITAHYAHERHVLLDVLARFDRLYRARKRQAGALDFADLEEYTVLLLDRHDETRDRLQKQFDHILMDEFQDTNGQQANLLRLVRPPGRFYAVGDINQSIFGFRHAEPEGFRHYREEVEHAGRRLVELVDNFRSRPEILSAVETIVAGADGIEPRSLVAGRKFDDARPVCVDVMSIAPDESAEAQFVARRILEFRPEFDFEDIAVLVRNTEVLAAFTAAFDDAAIPYIVNRGKGFYETREVNDLTHLLRVIANPQDEISLAVVLRSPLVQVSDEALLLRHTGAAPTEFSPEDACKLSLFRDRLHEWRIRREYVSFDRLLLEAIDDSGYPWTPNIDKFLAQARDAASRMSLDQFVDELALVRASNPREPDAPPEDSVNAVKVMTVHSAKGLEFPVVFVAALHKGIDTNLPVVAFSRDYGLGARWRNPAVREDKSDLFQHAIHEERKIRERDESNRLLYVAMTRAEQHLVLSFSGSGRKPAHWAGVVTASLGLDVSQPCDEVLTRIAPDGKPWSLRLLVAQGAQPAQSVTGILAVTLPSAVEFLSAPLLTGQHDTNATVTDLAAFANCPREYYLGKYLGFEGRVSKAGAPATATAADLPANELGSQVHALLAGTPVPDPHPDAQRLAAVFRQSPLGRRVARGAPWVRRVEREFAFLMAVEDLVIRGQIDLWFEDQEGSVIVDYKTDDVTVFEAHHRARDYELQLRLYSHAVERFAGRPPGRAWLHFLRPDTLVEVDLTPSLLESPEQIVRDFQEAQSRQEFPLNESERCRRCPFFRDLCPATLGLRPEPRP